MTDLEALVVAAYVFADEYPVPAGRGRPAKVSDAELIALAVAQAAIGFSSDRQFLGAIGPMLPGWFPHLPDQSQYKRRLRQLVGLMSHVQQRLARWLDTGGGRLSDGTLLAVASYPRLRRAERVRRLRPLRLREVSAPVRLRRAAGRAHRQPRPSARLHPRARQREGIRAARRPAHRHPSGDRDRRQRLLGPRLRAPARRRRRCSPRTRPAPPPTSPASGHSPRSDS